MRLPINIIKNIIKRLFDKTIKINDINTALDKECHTYYTKYNIIKVFSIYSICLVGLWTIRDDNDIPVI